MAIQISHPLLGSAGAARARQSRQSLGESEVIDEHSFDFIEDGLEYIDPPGCLLRGREHRLGGFTQECFGNIDIRVEEGLHAL